MEQNPDYLPDNIGLAILVRTILALPVIAASIYPARLCRCSVKQQRFLPAGTAVRRDTRAFEGRQAIWRGRISMTFAMPVFIAADSISLFLWYIHGQLAVKMSA